VLPAQPQPKTFKSDLLNPVRKTSSILWSVELKQEGIPDGRAHKSTCTVTVLSKNPSLQIKAQYSARNQSSRGYEIR